MRRLLNDFKVLPRPSFRKRSSPIKLNVEAIKRVLQVNPWVQFGFEESHYQSNALPSTKDVCTTKISGVGNCTSVDWRTEFGPVFTF